MIRPSQTQGTLLCAGMWGFDWGGGLGKGPLLIDAGLGGQISCRRRDDQPWPGKV